MPWTDGYTAVDFVSAEERSYPFNVWNFNEAELEREQITLMFPVGKTLAEAPKNIKLTCKGLEYSIVYKALPDRLIATRELKCNNTIISPSNYAEFKEFFNKIAENDTKQIGFK